MKAFWRTKSRRERRGAPRLSLFPFLAVLICTMGALILLLLFVSRQARLQAAREASARTAQQQSSIAAEMDMVQWRVEQLKKSRQDTEAQLGQARMVLGHIEEHRLRLRQQFRELSLEAKKAAEEGLKPGRMVAPGEAELRQIEGQIAEAQQQLTRAEQAAGKRPKSFAIVPYEGPNRTRRRPIYIECRGDAVVLQPENIRFTETDFDEPLGPGNPLAAAVRAARELMLSQGSADPQNTGEPYPLLLVRPSGISAYDAALGAMKSWGSEFGYELINEDWQLKFPPPDANVVKVVNEAIVLARAEHDRLIAAAPSKYGKRPRNGSFRSPTGDDADLAGGGGESESPGFYSSRPSSDRYASQSGGGPTAAGRGGRGSGGNGSGGNGLGGNGLGSGSGSGDNSSVPASDIDFREHNPYAALDAPAGGGPVGVGGSAGGIAGGKGNGPGYGPGTGPGTGAGGGPGGLGGPGYGPAGGPPGTSPAGMGPAVTGNGTGFESGNGRGGPGGSNYAGGAAGPAGMGPLAQGNGTGYGTGNGPGGPGSLNSAGGAAGPAGMGTVASGNGTGYGAGNGPGGPGSGAGGPAGASFTVGMPGSAGTGPGGPGGMAGPGGTGAGGGDGSGYGPGNGMGGTPGSAVSGGIPGSSTMSSSAGNSASAGGPGGMPSDGQTGGSPAGMAVARPDGYITGRPTDGTPPPQQPAPPPSGLAMGPASPLLPGEYRPNDPPPKPDPDAEAKEKKKHPYDKVKLDHDRDDWALRNSARHAAAISRPIHVDCYPDRVVLVPEEAGGETRVILCEQGGRRDADKLVAAVWEIMDTWGMAGREMYWRPILKFYVAAGAEPRMLDLARSLDGSGLVIERKQ